jgi:hypothetical protein
MALIQEERRNAMKNGNERHRNAAGALGSFRIFMLFSSAIALLALACGAMPCRAQAAPRLSINGVGKGAAAIDGPWQFHLGDDPAWAAPGIDDDTGHAGWEQITADEPWGAQGHRSYAGYAWYRKHLVVTPAAGASPAFALLIERIENVYEIYWNGKLIARHGKMPPGPSYPYSLQVQTFEIGALGDGVLAVRVWKAPLDSFDTGLQGGFYAPPLVGSAAAIADRKTDAAYRWLHSRQYFFALNFLYALVTVLSLLAWLRARERLLLLWLSLYCLTPLISLVLVGLNLPWSHDFALGWLQPMHGLADISLWFLLLSLLGLTENRGLVRVAIVLSWVDMTANVLDGALTMLDWSNPATMHFEQAADAFLTIFETLPELLPIVLVIYGLRKKQDSARLLVSVFAFLVSLIMNTRIAVSQGSRYTHWTLAAKINAPLFTVNGNAFTAITLANTGLLLAIIYAVYCYMRETGARHAAIEQELRNAQELQKVLIPETLPVIAGYALTSSYNPAQEVGGDFFQVIALDAGAALVVVGDVSGKGLRAAMAVSLLVGTVRTLAEISADPADILARLNHRMQGRLQHGFVTCLVLRLDEDGECVIANAGHPSPFLNAQEVSLPDALPLGLVPSASYETTTIHLGVSDRLTLYTDGLLEARNADRELYGFERLQALIATQPDARQAIEAAIIFGQEDDITVLTLTRLAVGEASSTQLNAPVLAPA